MCSEVVHSILLLSLVDRCLDTIDYVYGACLFFICCSDCVRVCGNVCWVVAVVEYCVH